MNVRRKKAQKAQRGEAGSAALCRCVKKARAMRGRILARMNVPRGWQRNGNAVFCNPLAKERLMLTRNHRRQPI